MPTRPLERSQLPLAILALLTECRRDGRELIGKLPQSLTRALPQLVAG